MWTEVYRNTFSNMNDRFLFIRSGSGIVFNNQVSGSSDSIDIDFQRVNPGGACQNSGRPLNFCNGAQSIDGNIEGTGWACTGQPGRVSGGVDGGSQLWFPFTEFKNGSESTCVSGGTCDDRTNGRINGPCAATHAPYLKTVGDAHSNGEVDYVNHTNVTIGTSLPEICTKGQGYWKTDEGEWWAANAGADGRFYLCSATNTWTLYYTPYTYPHPSQS
jgi:hypothetical protein